MPRLRNRPPQMLRYKGDKARVSINGKLHYLGEWGSEKAKAQYNRLIQQWHREREVEDVPINDRCLIAELSADYLEHVNEYYGQGHNRATSIAPVIRRFGLSFGDMWTDEFRPRHLEQAREIWIKRKCSRQYINRSVRDIVRCFKWGVTKDKVPAEVWRALDAVESLDIGRYGVRDAPDVEPVAPEVVDETLPHLPEQIADMVSVQLLSGCRPNEIMRLTPGQIDRAEDVWKYRPTNHKNSWRGKARTIYFGPQAQKLLQRYMLRGDKEPCFQTKSGKAFARGGYRQIIRRTIIKVNAQRQKDAERNQSEYTPLPHWTPNQLRHLKATELRRMRNLEAARAILGHTSTAVTEIYAEMNEQPAIEIARRLG